MIHMRVLMCAGFYDTGGFSTVMEKLAEKLAEKGHEVTIGALLFRRLPPEGAYETVRIPVNNVFRLRRFLEAFDIVHSHHPLTNYLSLLSNRPFIYHYHGAPDFGKGILHRIDMFSSIKLVGDRFNAVIAVSEAAAAELKQHFRSSRIYVIRNGVDTELFKPQIEPKFRKGEPQFLFVGNLYEHKNVEELIFALKELVKKYPKACLQIVGDGSLYERLKNLVVELRLEKNVDLVGRIEGYELPYYYASCDVYVTASRWELFGLPLLEAMACGKPVVASSITSHAELLAKSKGGTTYDAGNIDDLSQKMIKTLMERAKYSNNGITFASKSDWSIVAENMSKVYTRIAGDNSSG